MVAYTVLHLRGGRVRWRYNEVIGKVDYKRAGLVASEKYRPLVVSQSREVSAIWIRNSSRGKKMGEDSKVR
jgi:hypothetical protein